MKMVTELKKVKGLGSAKEGTHHWLMQRVTGLALVPMIIWLACSIISLVGSDYVHVKMWVQSPLNSIIMFLIIPTVFYHSALGIKVVIEDYVHKEFTKIITIMLLNFLFIAITVSTLFAILYINFKL